MSALALGLQLLSVVAGPLAAFAAAGRVAGSVRLEGARPPPRPAAAVSVDATVCAASVPDESLLVGADGGIRNAVVVLRGAPAAPARERPAALVDNAGCRFVPRVQVVVGGQTVRVRNSDPVLHNAHPVLVAEPEVHVANLALSEAGQTMDLTRRLATKLPAGGEALVRLRCDVHAWMTGWLMVVDHPYAAVTNDDGAFAVEDVPPGAYTLALWHEALGRTERPVTVPPGGTATVTLVLRAP